MKPSALALALALAVAGNVSAAADNRPNVLFIAVAQGQTLFLVLQGGHFK